MDATQEIRASISDGVSEGDVLAGKYRIDRVLGTGGMGVVAAAHHLQLDERVAIKFLLPQALQNSEAVARFAREARAAVKIKSEHVARVTDVGTLETGAPYMVMEYLEGADLTERLRKSGPLPVADAVEFILQACEAIAEAHGLGIVHRDLKPSNLFVIRRPDGSESVKVLDFGISKVTGLTGSGADLGMTKTQAMMGSPLYMSPEQMASSRDVDARTDIWALGITLYELLSGHPPFDAESIPQLCTMILQQQPAPLRASRPDAPPGLEAILFRCLEKDRNQRYANVAELANALVVFGPDRLRASAERISRLVQASGLAQGTGALPAVAAPVEATSAMDGTGTNAAWGRTEDGPRRSRTALVVGAVAATFIVVGGGLAFALLRGSSTGPDPAASNEGVAEPVTAAPATSVEPSIAVEPVVPAPETSAPTSASASASAAPPPAPPPKPAVHRVIHHRVPKPIKAAPAKTVATARKVVAPAPKPTRSAVDLYGDRK